MKDTGSPDDGLRQGLSVPGGFPETMRGMKAAWDGQSLACKGAMAEGLVGLLLGGRGMRHLAGAAVRSGGMALLAAVACKAWHEPEAERAPAVAPSPDLPERLLQALVAAAKADGRVSRCERLRIDRYLAQLDLCPDAQALIAAELESPLDPGRIAGLARSPDEAATIYAVSLMVVDPEGPAARGYLARLATRLGLAPELVAHLHARTATPG